MKKFVVRKAQTLKDFTDENYAQGSFAFSRLLRDRDIRVCGVRTGNNVFLSAGDEVVYADEHILILDKAAGVSSEALFAAVREAYGARFIHRLDRNTSGLIAFARTDQAEEVLLSAFRRRQVCKIYHALCFHPFVLSHACERAYLRKDERAARVFITANAVPGADPIETEYTVLEKMDEYSLVEIRLHSGKTHQIRAHMAFLGHPIAGDEKYGDEALNRLYRVKRQILVAKRLSFACTGCLAELNGREFVSSFSAKMPGS